MSDRKPTSRVQRDAARELLAGPDEFADYLAEAKKNPEFAEAYEAAQQESSRKLFPNRTDLRHQVLKAVAAGEVTILTTLFFKQGANRALDLFRDQGFVDAHVLGGKPYGLTADGETLLSQWDEEAGR